MNVAILVPIKDQSNAKSRLSPLLTLQERGAVAWAMFEDLTRALIPLHCPVALVTNSSRAASRAKTLEWNVIWEREQVSENASIDAASRQLAEGGADAVLRLPADLPLIQTGDVAELLSLPILSPSTVLVPSRDRFGTNALLRTPPCIFPSHFGPDSFALHICEATDRGIPFRVVENPRLGLDLDTEADVLRFLAQPADGETYRILMNLHIQERLALHANQDGSHMGPAGHS